MEDPLMEMGHAFELYAGCAGIALTMIASAIWWRIRSKARTELELINLEKNIPSARDGLLLSALVVDVVSGDGPVICTEPWLGELWVVIDAIVAERGLKKVGTYLNTFMAATPDFRVAEEALMRTAFTALDIRDAIHLFVASKGLAVEAKFGINADIIPTVGLGSTVALSQLWNVAMNLAEHGRADEIQLSQMAAEWLGPNFDIEMLGQHPVLYTRKMA